MKVNDFLSQRKKVFEAYDKGGLDQVTFLCAVTGIPCIAAYHFIYVKYQDAYVKTRLDSLLEFYDETVEEA